MQLLEKSSTPIAETLAGMYHTNIPFLESNKVPVIKRKFNFIPTGGKGDPPRALTDQPPLKTHFYDQHVVKSDFPKTMAYRMYGEGFKQFPDGTYHDAVMGLEEDYLERQKALKQVFAAPDVYQFMRADRENSLTFLIEDFFRSKFEEREEEQELFLRDRGLTPVEIKAVMSQKRMTAAAKALEETRKSDRIPVQRMGLNLRRADLIAAKFMDNGIELVSADDTRGVGNVQPLAKGSERYTDAFARKTPGAKTREERMESSRAIIAAGRARMDQMMGREPTVSATINEIMEPSGSTVITSAATVGGVQKKQYTMESIKQNLNPTQFQAFEAELQTLKEPTYGVVAKRGKLASKYGLTATMFKQATGLNAKK